MEFEEYEREKKKKTKRFRISETEREREFVRALSLDVEKGKEGRLDFVVEGEGLAMEMTVGNFEFLNLGRFSHCEL